MILSSPPQFGQCSRSIPKAKLQRRRTCTQVMSQLKTRLSNRPQLMRAGLLCAQTGAGAARSEPSGGLFVPGEGSGHWPGAACKATQPLAAD